VRWQEMSVGELDELSASLGTIETWLREDCPEPMAAAMADDARKAAAVVDELCDERERQLTQ
jgi:hypothetical protein